MKLNQAIRIIIVTFLVLSVAGAHAQTTLYTFNGDSASDLFGYSVSGAGDVNGDGFDDLIVGAIFDDNNGDQTGSARVLSGFDGSVLYTFYGDSSGDWFGRSVSGAGDVNDDGFADLIVGAPLDDNNGTSSGSAQVFSGADGSVLYTFNGDFSIDTFGSSVSGAGDVNGDGFADLIVGAPTDFDFVNNFSSNRGCARVFSGFDGSVLYTFDGDDNGDTFGGSVSGAGDVNGDGFADLIVGASSDDNNALTISGSARVLSGIDGSILYTFNGDSAQDFFGSSVSGAGDVNADGFADLIVGTRLNDANNTTSGRARVFSGLDGSVLHTFDGDAIADKFGHSVSGAGDVNGDGFADLIVGAYLDANQSGKARVFSGLDGSVLYTFNGDSVGDVFGFSVSGAGDVDGDGFADLIVGAWLDDNNFSNSGSARVIVSDATLLGVLENLKQVVVELNLSLGIEKSLDAKLDVVSIVLVDLNNLNDKAAIFMLQAFITQVDRQSGIRISDSDATQLVTSAQAIIDVLTGA